MERPPFVLFASSNALVAKHHVDSERGGTITNYLKQPRMIQTAIECLCFSSEDQPLTPRRKLLPVGTDWNPGALFGGSRRNIDDGLDLKVLERERDAAVVFHRHGKFL